MPLCIITYDLNKESKRPDILADIRKGTWAKLSESSYAVLTPETPKQVYDRLAKHLDGNDTLYVITLNRPYYGQGSAEVNDWLEKHLPR